MDKSNPKLYEKLQAYKGLNVKGINAFVEAQKITASPLVSKVAAVAATDRGQPGLDPLDVKKHPAHVETLPLSGASTPATALGTSPSLCVIVVITFELTCYFLIRQSVAIWEYVYVWRGQLGKLRQRLRGATTYVEWKAAALALDTHMQKDAWRRQPKMAYYDYALVADLLKQVAGFRRGSKVHRLMEILLQAGLRNNVGNIDSVRLYSNTFYGTKQVVEDFLNEVVESLNLIGASDEVVASEKKRFFKAAFLNFGRSALCLSGGASLAFFHFGVVRTLLDNGMLPKIITGTSAGSMIAAMIACRTDDELRELLTPDIHVMINACAEPLSRKLRRLFTVGSLFSSRDFAEKCQWAYRLTGKILNITAVPHNSYGPTKLFNYLSTPDVLLHPGVLEPITLMVKTGDGTLEPYLGPGVKWRDGSIKADIPIESLNAQFNVKYTIVSQANPHVAVFYYENRGSVGRPAAHRNGKGWRGGFLAASLEHYLKLDLKKWLRVLRDLELLPFIMQQDVSHLWLQKFDGNVTILPFIRLHNYVHIVSDPNLTRMTDYFKCGALKTWPKLHMIHNRTKVEHTIFHWLNPQLHPNGTPEDSPHPPPINLSVGSVADYSETGNPATQGPHPTLLDFLMDSYSDEDLAIDG
ncbi:hypothetical protein L0F63_001310 [Massospora cicadina]|nr:hypothetical protein L0F63_001310 [Massospora cicadina]